jgi:hypothetical protein
MFGLVAYWHMGNDKQNQRKEVRFEKSKHDASGLLLSRSARVHARDTTD